MGRLSPPHFCIYSLLVINTIEFALVHLNHISAANPFAIRCFFVGYSALPQNNYGHILTKECSRNGYYQLEILLSLLVFVVFLPALYLDVAKLHLAECIDKRLCQTNISNQWNIVVDSAAAYSISIGQLTL